MKCIGFDQCNSIVLDLICLMFAYREFPSEVPLGGGRVRKIGSTIRLHRSKIRRGLNVGLAPCLDYQEKSEI
ncbi:hypothetical protein N7537_002381 [Penicillium hordei]|uniref:Uncharacterized protein n=1 Tax=Penicillium hordei TaxID=40994 RepID=A0AAD6H8R3_9EURO|nr:uncharacterized protein N7537_002381 [Penicillium hordei]KAJ5617267.1 hypothetical protein N7537_002381 [Penicillium hordei]